MATTDGTISVLGPQSLARDRWQPVSFVVPADLASVGRVGLQVEVVEGQRASLRIDDVTW